MPCVAPVRGKTDTKLPWIDAIQNDPCGCPIVSAVAGVDVSAQNLCLPHYTAKYGQAAVPKGVMGGIDASTVFCFHADSLSDTQGHPLTALGDARIDAAQSKFGGNSLLLDGTGDYLTSPDSPDWDLGGGDFTIDFWYRPAVAVIGIPVAQYTNASKGWLIQLTTTTIYLYYSVDGTTALNKSPGGFTWVAGTWYHVAVVRNGNTLLAFVNGASAGAAADLTGVTIWNSIAPLSIGADGAGGQPVNGNLDEVRISKVARWTAAFTPPPAPYT